MASSTRFKPPSPSFFPYSTSTPRPTTPSPLGLPPLTGDRPSSRASWSPRLSPVVTTAEVPPGELPHILRQRQSIVTFLLAEKQLDVAQGPQSFCKRRRRRKRFQKRAGARSGGGCAPWNVLGRLLGIHGRALLVLIGQTALLSLTYTLFLVVLLRGPTALSSSAADFAKKHARLVTVVIVLLASAFSALTSMLFSYSIAYALNFYLITRTISIYQLCASISIMNRLPLLLFRFQRPLWTLSSLISLVMHFCLVACWTTLLIPTSITTQTSIQATDINLQNEPYLLSALSSFPNSTFNSSTSISAWNNQSHSSLLDDLPHQSGLIASGIQAGQPSSTWRLNRFQFPPFTAGAYPPTLPSSTPPYTLFLPSQLTYTSAVSCRPVSLAASPFIVPRVRGNHSVVSLSSSGGRGMDVWRWSANCSSDASGNGVGEVNTAPYYSLTNSTLGLVLCPAGTRNMTFTLIMKTTGPLESSLGDFICTLDPYLTNVQVTYDDVVMVSPPSSSSSSPVSSPSTLWSNSTSSWPSPPPPTERLGTSPTLATYITSALVRTFDKNQGLVENRIASGFFGALDAGSRNGDAGDGYDKDVLARMMEAYIRAHVDASITILRSQLLSHLPSPSTSPSPSSSSSSSETLLLTGTRHHPTIGFLPLTHGFLLILIPLTLVPLFSLGLVVHVEVKRRREMDPASLEPDPYSLRVSTSNGGGSGSSGSFGGAGGGGGKNETKSESGCSDESQYSSTVHSHSYSHTKHTSNQTHTSSSTLLPPSSLYPTASLSDDITHSLPSLDFLNPFHFLSIASAGGITGTCGGRLRDELLEMGFGTEVRLGRVVLPGESEETADVGLVHVEYGWAV